MVYSGGFREALIKFKYYGALYVGRSLSHIMAQAFRRHFEAEEFDVVIPVPIHGRRLVSRGYNQTVVLGERFSAEVGIPMDRFSLLKTRDTPPQVGLSKEERKKNLRGSFGISDADAVRGKRVLLIDDVGTTGSTVAEAAKTIMKADAAGVCVLVSSFRPSPADAATEAPTTTET